MSRRPARARLVTPRFALVVGAGMAYFMALGVVLPVVPQYVEQRLNGGSLAVGVAVGALFVGAVLLRPYVGRVGDRVGRRVLIVAGAAVVAVSVLFYGAVESLPFLIGARALTGLGEAAFFVGAATMITDLAPADRRGEAISYWSVAVYGGLAFGPVLGEALVDDHGYGTVWVVAGMLAALAAVLGLFTRETERPARAAGPPPGGILNRAALGPGTLLFSGLIALAAFTAFVPLYVDDVGLGSADVVFLLYGGLILAVRIVGARLPDILGGRRSGAMALAATASGMTVMAVWGTSAGLLAGTFLFAVGASLLYPAFLLLALGGAPEAERASVVGTFSGFFDLSQGFGSLLVGAIAAGAGYRGAFGAGAVFAAAGLVAILVRAGRRARSVQTDELGAMAVEHPGP
ncbi:MAG TPA: MFS transporter [Acidimicrobiia bacterium]|nr:MFS transporter [Acidimicrobiia bacterium]